MRTSRPLVASLLVGLLAAPALADPPPQVNGTTPLGARRGEAAEVAVAGGNLGGNPRLIAPFAVQVEPMEGSDGATWKARWTVDAATAPGIYPIRVVTDGGISNPILFAVSQLPRVAELEENTTFETAQAIIAPAAVEGQLGGNDVDFFRFAGKAGQRIVVDALCARIGSTVDPAIRLTTGGRQYVASADDTPGLLIDARLTAVLPEDGDYVVEISDSRYQGGNRPVYRLLVGEIPVAEEVYPLGGRRGEPTALELRGGTLPAPALSAVALPADPAPEGFRPRVPGPGGLDVESLPPLAVSDLPEIREPADPAAPPVRAAAPVAFNGRIEPAGDEDRFVLAVQPGQKLTINVTAAEIGSSLDGVLQVLNAQGAAIANADDTTETVQRRNNQPARAIISPDPTLELTVPDGQTEVTLVLKDLQKRGGTGFPYRIEVEPSRPGFAVVPNDAQVNIPRGGVAAVPVTIARKGYGGPITLEVVDPPAGLTFRPGRVNDGQPVGVLTLAAAPDAAFGPAVLKVVGRGQVGEEAIVSEAAKDIVFAQQANLPLNSLPQSGLPAAPGEPTPAVLDAPAEPVEVVHGFGATVQVKATRQEKAEGALTISPLPLPPGIAIPDAKLEEKAGEVAVTINAAPEAALGITTVGLTAKGKLLDRDRTLDVPAIALNVVRPAAVELEAKELTVKAGTTAELKGKLVRRGPFKEAVTIKVDGLPAGLKAEPVAVAAEASEFTVAIVAEDGAAAATATAKVAPAFQLSGKDYPTPPVDLPVKVEPK